MSIKFDVEHFPFISLMEFETQWNTIGIEEMDSQEASKMYDFLGRLGDPISNDGVIDESSVFLVKATPEGLLDRLYGPCLYKDESDDLILKCGSNLYPVRQKKSEFFVGELTGTLEFQDKEKSITRDGVTYKTQYCVLALVPTDGDEPIEYIASVRTDLLQNPTAATIKSHLRLGKSLAFYLEEAPGGNPVNAIKMKKLGCGEFPVAEIEVIPPNENGVSYVLRLEDGRGVWAQGKVKQTLKGGFRKPEGKPLTLAITQIEIGKDAKSYVTCALRLRAPKPLTMDDIPF
jgi:hypothetical protein